MYEKKISPDRKSNLTFCFEHNSFCLHLLLFILTSSDKITLSLSKNLIELNETADEYESASCGRLCSLILRKPSRSGRDAPPPVQIKSLANANCENPKLFKS